MHPRMLSASRAGAGRSYPCLLFAFVSLSHTLRGCGLEARQFFLLLTWQTGLKQQYVSVHALLSEYILTYVIALFFFSDDGPFVPIALFRLFWLVSRHPLGFKSSMGSNLDPSRVLPLFGGVSRDKVRMEELDTPRGEAFNHSIANITVLVDENRYLHK